MGSGWQRRWSDCRHWVNQPLPREATFGSVAADEQREAASGDEVVVNSGSAVFQKNRVYSIYDCCAAERSLALLVSCYRGGRCCFRVLLRVKLSGVGGWVRV